MGNMALKGEGVPKDYVEAYKWFNIALPRFGDAMKEFSDAAVKGRDAAATQMTPPQIADAEQRARGWAPK
jgi:TPR repeat protein